MQELNLKVHPSSKGITMDQKTLNTKPSGYVVVNLTFNSQSYLTTHLDILNDLCSDVLLGQDFPCQYQKRTFNYGGHNPKSIVVSTNQFSVLNAVEIEKPPLFPNLSLNCKPIAVKLRHFNKEDQSFINKDI